MVCLDTSFLIDVVLGRVDDNKFKEIIDGGEIFSIASPSIIELVKGLYLERNLKHVGEKEIDRIRIILSSFNILNLDRESAVKAGRIEAELTNEGKIIDIEDIMIGAIAIENNESLLTRNKKHFDRIKGLKIESY
jgi:tRNA(fMet)-specific endonuclease VapC